MPGQLDIPEQNISMKRPTISKMNPEEANRYLTELGLGFGIDATSQSPWEERSVRQVCPIREGLHDVVISDEGGNWQTFHQKVESQ